jgi:diguanylate cyclase (GGDEF)-like protein
VFVKSRIARILYRLTMPGSLLLAASGVLMRMGVVTDSASQLMALLPAGIFAGGLILSMAFRRSRLFFALLTLGLAQAAAIFVVPRLEHRGTVMASALAILLPWNLAALAFLKERGIISPAGRRRLAVVAAEVLAVFLLCLPRMQMAAERLRKPFFPERFSAWSHISQAALVGFLLGAAVIMPLLVRRYRAVESSLLWSLVASFFALRLTSLGELPEAGLFFAAAGMALIVALLETSYQMAYHDELTQLPSRRALNEALMKLPSEYTIAMIDVDHFKKFNDSFGHEAGDQALRLVASRLAHIAGGGRAYRYGGEEFAILFPGKEASEVVLYLDRMRRLIEQSRFTVRGRERRSKQRRARALRKETNVTVSIGVATSNGQGLAPLEVMRVADRALYRAKAKGRNCTVNAKAPASVALGMRMADAV